jgi:ATP-dependent Clp endopeptidase proteolytic subunit ClpP
MFTNLVLAAFLSLPLNLVVTPNKMAMDCERDSLCLKEIKQPIIIEVNEFTEESATKFAHQMAYAQQSGQTVIPIVIDSYGGDVMALFRMMSIVQSSRVPVATIVEGKAMSCGADLFMMGAEGMRFAGPMATIMIHDIASGAEGKLEEIKAKVEEMDRMQKQFLVAMSRNTKHPDDFFSKMLDASGHKNIFFTAEEAKKLNIVNKLGLPEFKVQIWSQYTLQ